MSLFTVYKWIYSYLNIKIQWNKLISTRSLMNLTILSLKHTHSLYKKMCFFIKIAIFGLLLCYNCLFMVCKWIDLHLNIGNHGHTLITTRFLKILRFWGLKYTFYNGKTCVFFKKSLFLWYFHGITVYLWLVKRKIYIYILEITEIQ